MALRIEDYAMIGDTQTAALVGRNGSIDWLCLPRFDSGACFAALLGTEQNGRWIIAPKGGPKKTRRRYVGDTLILETVHTTDDGEVAVVDLMPVRGEAADIVRIVEGRRGRVPMRSELIIRFDYGSIVPWVRRESGYLLAVAGPDALWLSAPVETHGDDLTTVSEFAVAEGDRIPFVLAYTGSSEGPPERIDAEATVEATREFWEQWIRRCEPVRGYEDEVHRSLITLKGLTYAPTGGIVAAATTSLPEDIGGVRNWDYRYCWLRDATFTLYSLVSSGYIDEAEEWREWLLRAVAGQPSKMQIMYGAAGERRLLEHELDWLEGYEGSKPVRVGNAAVNQLQLDVYGELTDLLHQAREAGIPPNEHVWDLQKVVMDFLEGTWRQPDEGIWEVRGPRRHFTHSKIMAWVAFDRAARAVERFHREGPADKWRAIARDIRDEVCREGFDAERQTFTQVYGSHEVDASLLMIPLVGFLPAHDDRVSGTVAAVERDLLDAGFVHRYRTKTGIDGLPGDEGTFIPCTFWYADNLTLMGRVDDATAVLERLLALRNDVGLLSEEYDTNAKRLVGNFPQAFSHVSLINTARNLADRGRGPAQRRGAEGGSAPGLDDQQRDGTR
ncbi:MAG: glycoside hydrolase family 15 protein [Actinomycetota bacterium]|nr:glycoside hydrolase family 15 protein [Actinomycetota bacterium]